MQQLLLKRAMYFFEPLLCTFYLTNTDNTSFEVEYYKLIDEIIEYLLLTTEVTLALFWGVTNSKRNEDSNFRLLIELVQLLSEKLNFSRNVDICLDELRKQVLEIMEDE